MDNTKCLQRCGATGTLLYTAGGNVKCCNHLGKLAVLKKLSKYLIYNLTIPFLGICSREMEAYVHTKKGREESLVVMGMFIMLIVLIVSRVCASVKTHQIVHCKYEQLSSTFQKSCKKYIS